jgi:hypothetical protein
LVAILALLAVVMVLRRSRLWVFAGFAIVELALGATSVPGYGWHLAGVIGAVIVVVGVSLAPWPVAHAQRLVFAGVVVALVASVPYARWYDDHRFSMPQRAGPTAAFDYFRTIHNTRIGVGSFVRTYPLDGPDLTNWVQIVGTPGAHGAFRPAADCVTWQRLVDRDDFAYVVVGRNYHVAERRPHERFWTAEMPNARLVLHNGSTTVFRLTRPGSPPHCRSSRAVSHA